MSWRTPVTLTVLLVLVLGAGWYGWLNLFDSGDADSTGCVEEELAKGTRLRARQVLVNVYNAGDVDGLAGETMDALQQRGFRPGSAENAPERLRVRTVAVYDSQPGSAPVRLVALQLGEKAKVFKRPDIAEGVDVVVGSRFQGIDRQARLAVSVPGREEVCVPAPR